jgi:hypothetical protein
MIRKRRISFFQLGLVLEEENLKEEGVSGNAGR